MKRSISLEVRLSPRRMPTSSNVNPNMNIATKPKNRQIRNGIIAIAGCIILQFALKAQTSTFSTDGNVGIGTTNPIKATVSVAGPMDAQGSLGFSLDENNLTIAAETEVANDSTAEGGKTILRRSSAEGNPCMWWGPYAKISPGNYLVQFRMKVASNQSDTPILTLDATVDYGANTLAHIVIKPSDFRQSGEWQIFTFPISVTGEDGKPLEIRGMNFCPNITDIYLDYINAVAGDMRGFYSGEFSITPKGRVGVGIANPSHPLTVNGAIRAREVIVDTGWADDVFKPGYRLASLQEVEKHIQENQRLPGMPSEKQVREQGASIGDAQGMLLRKVEELTLHMIALEKRMKELEVENTALKAKFKFNEN